MSEAYAEGSQHSDVPPKVISRIAPHVSVNMPYIMTHLPDPIQKPKRSKKNKEPKVKVLPPELEDASFGSNKMYRDALSDQNLVFKTNQLGFLPANYWVSSDNTFGSLVTGFFQKKNNSNCRFTHKLFNGLLLVKNFPKMYPLIGLMWVTNDVFKVHKFIFGRLIGIQTIDGGLMHCQGNFPSHGFTEITGEEFFKLKTQYKLDDVDQDVVRLMTHKSGKFTQESTEDILQKIKWQ